jgi:hypothetical protein
VARRPGVDVLCAGSGSRLSSSQRDGEGAFVELARELGHPILGDDVRLGYAEAASDGAPELPRRDLARAPLEASCLHDPTARREAEIAAGAHVEEVDQREGGAEHDRGLSRGARRGGGVGHGIDVERAGAEAMVHRTTEVRGEALDHEAERGVGLLIAGGGEHDRTEARAIGEEEALAPGDRGALVGRGGAERMLATRVSALRGAAGAEDDAVVRGRVRGEPGEAKDVAGHSGDRVGALGRGEVYAAGAGEAGERGDALDLEAGDGKGERVKGLRRAVAQRGVDEGHDPRVQRFTLGVGRGHRRAIAREDHASSSNEAAARRAARASRAPRGALGRRREGALRRC